MAFSALLCGVTSKSAPGWGQGTVLPMKTFVERKGMPGSLAHLPWRCFGKETLSADRAGTLRAVGDTPQAIWEAETETFGYLPSPVTWMRNGPGGSCDGNQGEHKRIHLLSWQEICSLDSVAADIMISFPSVKGD